MSKTHDQNNAQNKFGNDVSALFQPYNPSFSSLKKYILGYAQRCHLNGIDPFDILSQAILQGLEQTRKNGEEIHNVEAWLRIASMGILANQVRDNIRCEKISTMLQTVNPIISDSPIHQIEFDDRVNQLCQARQALSIDDQEILTLYLDQDKTYEQIQAYYQRKDGKIIDLRTIRKRVSRAKSRVIKAFHHLEKSTTSESKETSLEVEGNKNHDHSLPP